MSANRNGGRETYQKVISTGVIVALTILMLGVLNSYRNINTLVAASHAVSESHRTLEQLQQVSALLNDTVGASRGYVLTQRQEFIESYRAAREHMTPVLDSLAQREREEESTTSNVSQLRGLIQFRLLLQDELIRARDEHGFRAAFDLVQQSRSKQVSDQIQLLIARIESSELEALSNNERSSAQIEFITRRNILFVGFPAVLFLIAAGFIIKRDSARRGIAERAIAEAESRFRALLQNSNDIVVVINEKGILEYVSPAVERILGFGREEVLLRSVFEYVHPDDLGFASESFKNTLASPGATQPIQLRLRTRSHSYVYVELIGNNLLDDPNVRGLIYNARDITFRQQFLKRMGLSTAVTRVLGSSNSLEDAAPQLLQSICTSSGYLVAELWVTRELEGRVVCTHSWQQPELKETMEIVGTEYELNSSYGLIAQVCQARELLRVNNIAADPDFARRDAASPLELRGAVGIPITFEESVYAVVCLYSRESEELDEDITLAFNRIGEEIGAFIARKQAEKTQHRLTAILEATPDFVIIATMDKAVQYANHAARERLGWEVGPNVDFAAFHPEWAWNVIANQAIPAAIRDACWTGETAVLARDGKEIPVSQILLSYRTPDGEVEFLATVMRDISDRKAVERMKDDFISMVSHELRTPLTSIRASLGLLASGQLAQDDVMAKRMLELANINTVRLVRLVNDILDIERLDSGRLVMQKRRTEAAQMLLAAASSMHPPCHDAGISLIVQPGRGIVNADPDRILQTLTNLIGNAIKFSPRDSTIHLSTKLEGDRVVFLVADKGRGVPKEKQEIIFERFQQVDVSDSRLDSGTGLGLAICRSIVRSHAGEIWVESEPGEGSTFCFYIPLATSSPTTKFPPEGEVADAARPGN